MRHKIWLASLVVGLCLTACQKAAPTEIVETAATSTEVAVIAEATEAGDAPTNAPTLVPSATPRPKPDRVMVLSMPNAGMIAALGEQHPMQSAELATTAVTHNSLAAGRWPTGIGIVGERIHRPEDGIYWYTSAFELPMVGAEPIWKTASAQGLVTAALFWPGATPLMPDQMADYTVGYGQRDSYSALHEVSLYTAGIWANPPNSYSPMQEGIIQIRGDEAVLGSIYVLGVDATDDNAANGDTFVLSQDRAVDAHDAVVNIDQWVQWTLDEENGQGADLLITGVEADKITVFQSRVYSVLAAPDDLRQELIKKWGYFAPEPDYYGLEAGWIMPHHYMQMVRRQSTWMMDVSLWLNERYHPDLLMTTQNPMDQAGHQFMLTDARQEGYSQALATEYHGYMEEAAAQADHVVERFIDAQNDTTALMVVSPLRLQPIHTRVNLNIALSEAGLLRLGSRGFVVMPATQAIAFSSGGAAHIYINAVGREEEGIVAAEDIAVVADQIVELLRAMVDPQTGEPIFSKVGRQDELESLNGLYAGDVFAQANVGYWLDDETNADAVFAPVSFYGQEGYDRIGWLSVMNWNVREEIQLVDIAPSIAWLLDFDLSGSDGRSIFED